MRIRYIKADGSGVEDDQPDAVAQRLIDSGAAEAVEEGEQAADQATGDEPHNGTPRKTAAKTAHRSK